VEVPCVVIKHVSDVSGWPLHANIGWRCPPSGSFRSKLLETGSTSRVMISLLSHHVLGRSVMDTIGRKPVIGRSKTDQCLLGKMEDISEERREATEQMLRPTKRFKHRCGLYSLTCSHSA
jgi:hypothetical protein